MVDLAGVGGLRGTMPVYMADLAGATMGDYGNLNVRFGGGDYGGQRHF